MKPFHQLLIAAPALLTYLHAPAVFSNDLKIDDVNDYVMSSRETDDIGSFSDVYPTDWTYKSLSNLRERSGCKASLPSIVLTRFEAAALLNKCLENIATVSEQEQALIDEFQSELEVIRGKASVINEDFSFYEAGMFSTTTNLSGYATFVIGAVQGATEGEGTTFNYKYGVDVNTSFFGDDLLYTAIETGNFGSDNAFGGSAPLETALDGSNNLSVGTLYYTFPMGEDWTAWIGPSVRQDDMLPVWPSDYPSQTMLDVMTYAGASGAYNLASGSGAGISYNKDNLFLTANFVNANGDDSSKGVLTKEGGDTVTGQIAFVEEGWGGAFAYSKADNVAGDFSAIGFSGWWIPEESGAMPSISAGIGTKDPDNGEDELTWVMGLQWRNAFSPGNTLGIATGVATTSGWYDVAGGNDVHDMSYEAWYDIAISDHISVTPGLFLIEQSGEDMLGALVKTTFTF